MHTGNNEFLVDNSTNTKKTVTSLMSITPTAIGTELPSANSPTMHCMMGQSGASGSQRPKNNQLFSVVQF